MWDKITGKIASWYLAAPWWKRGLVGPLISIGILVAFALVMYSVLVLPFKIFGWYGLVVWVILIILAVLEGIRDSALTEKQKADKAAADKKVQEEETAARMAEIRRRR